MLTGFARVWLGTHWVPDVLAGYAFGGLQLALLIGLTRRIEGALDVESAARQAGDPTVARRLRIGSTALRRVGTGCAIGTALLIGDAIVRDRGSFDVRVMETIQWIDLPHLRWFLDLISTLTMSYWGITLWAAVLVSFAAAGWWLPMLATSVIPLGVGVNKVIREYLVERPRPSGPVGEGVGREGDLASFPSGHVVGAVLLYGLLLFVSPRIRQPALRRGVQLVSGTVLALVGFSRVWLGSHWLSDVLAGYTLGGLLLVLFILAYQRIEDAVGDVPFLRAALVPHDESRPHAHALTSTILFEGDTVAKVYAPGFVPRTIYWLAFQAPFPYAGNRAALEAAVLRRNLAGLLTEYWYGSNRVAPARGVAEVEGRPALRSAYVDGQAPRNEVAARAFLFGLCDRFDEAGLPTWQVDPRQPRALSNILETADGGYVVIDLESGLVSPLASPLAWRRALRRNQVPLFDDVFFDLTRAYVEREADAMRVARGDAWLATVRRALDEAEAAAGAWHAGEPRIWSRMLRGARAGFGVRTWPTRLRSRSADGQAHANAWLSEAVAEWRQEDRITAVEEAEVRAAFADPRFQAVVPHLGVHFVIGVALRFPFGSVARAAWTAGNLVAATTKLLTRRIDRRAWRRTVGIHSPLVILLALIPGFGTFAYLASGPVRSNHLMIRIAADGTLSHLPWQLYQRVGLRRLIVRPPRRRAGPDRLDTGEGQPWVP